jgi:hypothetical protein
MVRTPKPGVCEREYQFRSVEGLTEEFALGKRAMDW